MDHHGAGMDHDFTPGSEVDRADAGRVTEFNMPMLALGGATRRRRPQ
jgi:hypothetical protein